ncbi:MAG: hypothetical protein KAU24_02865 [Candidatus Aenigmarchaeota archaeon]|nr:hypothetical protein [Candidatus Aenigmarchaeota archaeon]
MKKSDLIKNVLDKQHDHFLEEYRNLFYLLIGLIIAYVTSEIYNLETIIQLAFFEVIILVVYLLVIVRKKLGDVRNDVLRIEIEKINRKKTS